jgi:hypothetical protein
MPPKSDECNDAGSSLGKRKTDQENDGGIPDEIFGETSQTKKVKRGSDSPSVSLTTKHPPTFDSTSTNSYSTKALITSVTNPWVSLNTVTVKVGSKSTTQQQQQSNLADNDSHSVVNIIAKPIINFDIQDKFVSPTPDSRLVSVGSPSHDSIDDISTDDNSNVCSVSDSGKVENEEKEDTIVDEVSELIITKSSSDNSEHSSLFITTIIKSISIAFFYAAISTGIYLKLNPSTELNDLVNVVGGMNFSNFQYSPSMEFYLSAGCCIASLALLVKLVAAVGSKTKTKERSKYRSSWYITVLRITWIVIFYAIVMTAAYIKMNPSPVIPNSVYIAGGGFSGFWYTLGRIQSMDDFNSKEIYCYSAGCLAAVSLMTNLSMANVLDSALDIQSQWKAGSLHRYDVIQVFVNNLLTCQQDSSSGLMPCVEDEDGKLLHPLEDVSILDRLHIITTEIDATSGSLLSWVKPVERKVQNVKELKHILQQSTWIPYVVGNGLSLDGHLDGAYTFFAHPTCEYHAGLTTDIDLLLNVVNIDLGRDKAEQLFQKGRSYALAGN